METEAKDDSDENELHIAIKDENEEVSDENKEEVEKSYKCKTCKTPVGFPSLVQYLQHLRDEHKEKVCEKLKRFVEVLANILRLLEFW